MHPGLSPFSSFGRRGLGEPGRNQKNNQILFKTFKIKKDKHPNTGLHPLPRSIPAYLRDHGQTMPRDRSAPAGGGKTERLLKAASGNRKKIASGTE